MIPSIETITWYRKKYWVVAQPRDKGTCESCFFGKRAAARGQNHYLCPIARVHCWETISTPGGEEIVTRDVICIEATPEAFAEYIAEKLGVNVEVPLD